VDGLVFRQEGKFSTGTGETLGNGKTDAHARPGDQDVLAQEQPSEGLVGKRHSHIPTSRNIEMTPERTAGSSAESNRRGSTAGTMS
jgi:hypothetical protein